jgi:uncharacterized protein YicC (UPF0701 family)
MTNRHNLILKLIEKQNAVMKITESMHPSYNPMGGRSSLDMTTYQRYIKELAALNDEIYQLKKEIGKLPKEQNPEGQQLKEELSNNLKSANFQKQNLQQKIDNSNDWGLDNLRKSMSLLDQRIQNNKILLDLL